MLTLRTQNDDFCLDGFHVWLDCRCFECLRAYFHQSLFIDAPLAFFRILLCVDHSFLQASKSRCNRNPITNLCHHTRSAPTVGKFRDLDPVLRTFTQKLFFTKLKTKKCSPVFTSCVFSFSLFWKSSPWYCCSSNAPFSYRYKNTVESVGETHPSAYPRCALVSFKIIIF